MNRDEALTLVKENVGNKKLLNHMLAVEAIMRRLAEHLGENVEVWGLTGLLHDIDYEKTLGNPKAHGLVAEEILGGRVKDEVVRAIKAHNYENTGVEPLSTMEKALIAADSISGLIIACALVMPSKKLRDVKLKTIRKKFKDKDFARGSSRERIMFCEEIGIERDEFFKIALEALQSIGEQLGL